MSRQRSGPSKQAAPHRECKQVKKQGGFISCASFCYREDPASGSGRCPTTFAPSCS
ncbi:hypothetical protein BN871_DS_00120 [Paenibacillus sp. P22]|nr:hypothetical protein BN871_DS_00120 [Paenibacillus sp. P22]